MKNNTRKFGFQALLVTQFLEAFNDNALKVVVTFVAIDYFTQHGLGTFYVSLAGVVFILPFILFSTFAGYLADRFTKKNIIICAKVAELVILLFGLITFIHINIWGMLAVLFFMGLHSAFLSPSKYAILPEILDKDNLSWGNGQLQMWTYAAIILGQAAGGYLLQIVGDHIFKAYFVFIGIAIVGIVASLCITNVSPSGAKRKPQWNFIKEVWQNIFYIRQNRAIFLSIVGLVYFAFLGGIFQPNILLYARTMMGADHLSASLLLVSISLGIGLGGLMAGRFSDQKIELGLVPMGAMGISLFSILLGFNYSSYLSVVVTLFLLGLSSGFYIVPLNTLVQYESPEQERGKIIATNNFLSFTAILIASFAVYVFGEVLKVNPANTFVFLGLATILGAIYICRLLPYPLVRLSVWVLAHTIYKIRAIDKDNVPSKGGALLVSNHVSFVDAVMIVVTVSRPIRFMISREVYNSSIFHPLFKLGGAIPVNRTDSPKEILRALNTAKEAINAGELVCIFPEGQLTRTGNILKFNAGIEHIVKGVDCPIIPIHLDRIWGSIFSWEGGKYLRKWPKIIPYPVTVTFGKPLPATTSAFEIRSRIMELGAEAFKFRLEDKLTLPESFWREARKHPGKFCIADSSGKKLNNAMTLILSVALSRELKPKLDQEKMIGVLIPPSVGGALVNIAVSMLNKVPVNINYTSSQESVASIVKQCAMQYVITSRQFLEKSGVQLSCEKVFIEDVLAVLSKMDLCKAFLMSFVCPSALSRLLVFGPREFREHEKLATVMFTSGSTGEPKGVMLTHGNVTSNLEGLYQVFNIKNNDVMMGILPFFHSFGFTATLWFPLISGIGAVYHFNPLDAKVIGKLVKEYKTTILMTTPTFLSSYIRRCEVEQFKSLRMVTVGAEKLKNAIANEFKEKFGVEPMEGYGCTELSPVVSINLPDHGQGDFTQKAQKRGSIGLPLPGIAVKIVDQNTGEQLGPGRDGLLLIKGPNVMKGYLNNPEKTAEVIKDGWYTTGDIAQVDEDGFITITDRLSRFSKIGGEMVPHIKIEEAIHKVLNSSEQIAVVTSVPDEKKGEKLVVLYIRDLEASVLIEGLKKEGIPNLWIPAMDSFFRIEDIPLLGSGKINLGAIKRKAQDVYAKKQERI
ncbi:MAG: MFS transporter [Candidatus Omnitrophica bacterium]|nr:MFS transporter [Candidatus Omnitrophota bacterium]